ncbi:DNA polymerase III subunit beta [Iamia sp.]|uniref:DNA polymerase III subunit beta n=1 Tax=Iamia sp. TaxID=2722710 RepID=UPI002C59108B|nr:DNA polymerase III subunit beta [Iamia sp.]HXH57800.1 DNA polymerase III subunit beta [Iamia sp.]
MKFRCERDDLVEALGTAGRAVANRGGALPVLSGVRLELEGDTLRLTGSDLDLTISVTTTVAGESNGVAVVPAKIASDVVRSLDSGRVEIVVEDDEAQITSGRFASSIRLLPADEFPRLASPAENAVTLDAGDLSSALSQVVPAASSDDARPILTGVLMAAEGNGLRLVATDSYRLAVRDLEGSAVLDEGQTVLVPSRALRELVRALGDGEVTLRLGEREATFEVGSTRVTTRLIEGEFPNYRGLIPSTYPNRMVVSREALGDAVRRVRLMAREATPVRLTMSAEGLELDAVTQDIGQARESVDATFDGTELTVGFNPDYLLDGIEVAPGEEITLETTDANKPAVLRSVDRGDFLYLLMPVRI